MSLTQEERTRIRKSLPLKIFGRRQEARDCLENIEYFKDILSKAMRIDDSDGNFPKVVLSGQDVNGNAIEASCAFYPRPFKRIKEYFTESIGMVVKRNERLYSEIPDAKIIPVDFRNKTIDTDRCPGRNIPVEQEQPRLILSGAFKIAREAGVKYSKFADYVVNEGLPAFKIPNKRPWYAFPEEIVRWKKKRLSKD